MGGKSYRVSGVFFQNVGGFGGERRLRRYRAEVGISVKIGLIGILGCAVTKIKLVNSLNLSSASAYSSMLQMHLAFVEQACTRRFKLRLRAVGLVIHIGWWPTNTDIRVTILCKIVRSIATPLMQEAEIGNQTLSNCLVNRLTSRMNVGRT